MGEAGTSYCEAARKQEKNNELERAPTGHICDNLRIKKKENWNKMYVSMMIPNIGENNGIHHKWKWLALTSWYKSGCQKTENRAYIWAFFNNGLMRESSIHRILSQ